MGKPLARAAGHKPAIGFAAAAVAESSVGCAIEGLKALRGRASQGSPRASKARSS